VESRQETHTAEPETTTCRDALKGAGWIFPIRVTDISTDSNIFSISDFGRVLIFVFGSANARLRLAEAGDREDCIRAPAGVVLKHSVTGVCCKQASNIMFFICWTEPYTMIFQGRIILTLDPKREKLITAQVCECTRIVQVMLGVILKLTNSFKFK
jgi:hypothetical protein